MRDRPPILVVSRDEHVQDAYVAAMRRRRVPALGVSTCGAALEIQKHIRLGAVLVDVIAEEDWRACELLRRGLDADVPLVALCARVDPEDQLSTAARRIGCAVFMRGTCPPPAVLAALERIAHGDRRVEYDPS